MFRIPVLLMRRAVASQLCACALPITLYTHTEIRKIKIDLELFQFNAPKMALQIVCVFSVSKQQFYNGALG
jgi:hypothetical protein